MKNTKKKILKHFSLEVILKIFKFIYIPDQSQVCISNSLEVLNKLSQMKDLSKASQQPKIRYGYFEMQYDSKSFKGAAFLLIRV